MKPTVKIGIALLAISIIGSVLAGCDNQSDSESLQDQLEEAQQNEQALATALEEANDTIEQLNSEIEDAQAYAGSSYEEMEHALAGLETGSTTDDPR